MYLLHLITILDMIRPTSTLLSQALLEEQRLHDLELQQLRQQAAVAAEAEVQQPLFQYQLLISWKDG